MAQTVYLNLEINGIRIEGESRISSMEREGMIACSSFHHGLAAPFDPATLDRTGRRHYEPIRIHKLVDKSTPLLFKALCNNEAVTSAEFRFFRPSPSGAEQHFFTVLLERAFISSVRQVSEDAIVGGEAAPPMMEEVTFVFKAITWTYEDGGVAHRDQMR